MLLLKEFGWSHFHSKTKHIFSRMTGWLGINGYAFKDTILSVDAKFQPHLDLAQRLAGHHDVANTRLYT